VKYGGYEVEVFGDGRKSVITKPARNLQKSTSGSLDDFTVQVFDPKANELGRFLTRNSWPNLAIKENADPRSNHSPYRCPGASMLRRSLTIS
jgi:hypothetical protein